MTRSDSRYRQLLTALFFFALFGVSAVADEPLVPPPAPTPPQVTSPEASSPETTTPGAATSESTSTAGFELWGIGQSELDSTSSMDRASAANSLGTANDTEASESRVQPTEDSPVEDQRAWLRAQFTAGVTSVRQLKIINERVSKMSPEEVQRQYARWQRKAFEQRRAEIAAAETANVSAAATAPGYAAGGAVGYAPIIQWLGTGTQLTVSPYGGIGFGVSNYWPGAAYVPPYYAYHGPGCYCRRCRSWTSIQPPATDNSAEREIWYDGLRTRVGSRPAGATRSRP